MAVYKVPQDVEADDKLLGPFSFKQFIFLVIAVVSGGVAYILFQMLPILAIIPLPITIFFTIIALPLRKDQPTEVYLAAIISFILQPKKRLWEAGNVGSSVEITVPIDSDDFAHTRFSQKEVHQRMSYLANIVDSKGWAVRGVSEPTNSINQEIINEAQDTQDILDDDSETAKNINSLLEKTTPAPVNSFVEPATMQRNPIEENIQNQPIEEIKPINNTIPTSPAIINNTANRENFSIADIEQRVNARQTDNNEEVTISLR